MIEFAPLSSCSAIWASTSSRRLSAN